MDRSHIRHRSTIRTAVKGRFRNSLITQKAMFQLLRIKVPCDWLLMIPRMKRYSQKRFTSNLEKMILKMRKVSCIFQNVKGKRRRE